MSTTMNHFHSAQPGYVPVGQTDLSPTGFRRFADFIGSELGIKMPDSKQSMVQSRLLRRVRELGLESVNEYVEYFFSSENAEEREYFINAITTNKTDFFREPEHFKFLSDIALPRWTATYQYGSRFQAWSAGCSSGEEPYTIAMVLAEYERLHQGFQYAVLATDVSTRVLGKARQGIYEEAQIAPVPKQIRPRYLLRSRGEVDPKARVVPQLRSKVSFHALNFMDESYNVNATFDAIFFRNVMIYFDKTTQEAVVNKLCCNLAPGGYLFAGHSESLTGLDIPVRLIKTSVYQRPV